MAAFWQKAPTQAATPVRTSEGSPSDVGRLRPAQPNKQRLSGSVCTCWPSLRRTQVSGHHFARLLTAVAVTLVVICIRRYPVRDVLVGTLLEFSTCVTVC